MSRKVPKNLIDELSEAPVTGTNDVNIFEFNSLLVDHLNTLDKNKKISKWDEEGVKTSIRLIEEYKASWVSKMPLTYKHYNRAKVYNTTKIDGKLVLIKKRKDESFAHKVVPPYNQYHEILSKIHKTAFHAGRDRMLTILKKSYEIPRWAVEIVLLLCKFCQTKKKYESCWIRRKANFDKNLQ